MTAHETTVDHAPLALMGHAEFARLFLAAAYGPHNPAPPTWVQVAKVSGEAGEFVEAYVRYCDFARRPGNLDEVGAELADTVITAYVAAEGIGLDLDAAVATKREIVMSRGFRDPRPDESPLAAVEAVDLDPTQMRTYLVDYYLREDRPDDDWALLANASADDIRANLQEALRRLHEIDTEGLS